MSQIEPQNSEITRLSEEIFFLKEQIRNKDKVIDSLLSQLSKRDDVILQNRWPAIKRKIVSAKTVIVERRAATTMTASPTSTATTTTTTSRQMQTENKATNENLLKIPSGKTNINVKEKEKDTVNQNFTENIKGKEKRSAKNSRKRRQQESKNNKKGYDFR